MNTISVTVTLAGLTSASSRRCKDIHSHRQVVMTSLLPRLHQFVPSGMKATTVLFALVCALAVQSLYAQQYPGCTTDAQCKVTGDSVSSLSVNRRVLCLPHCVCVLITWLLDSSVSSFGFPVPYINVYR
jgi:hypothetical protein